MGAVNYILKSFQSFAVNDDLLAKVVEAVRAGEKEANTTGNIQSFEVFYKGFRQNIAIGRIYVVPPKVANDRKNFPIALLYGCIMKEFAGEELADLITHKIGETEFDEYSKADFQAIKDKLFKTEDGYECIVLFAPHWHNQREFVHFKFTDDEQKLANLVRHLIFCAYFDPRLSSAFNAMMTNIDTTKFDVTDITPKLNFPFLAEGVLKQYPDLQKSASSKAKVFLSAKTADAITQEMLDPQELNVFESLDQALTQALMPETTPVNEFAEGDFKPPTSHEIPEADVAAAPDNTPSEPKISKKVGKVKTKKKATKIESYVSEGRGGDVIKEVTDRLQKIFLKTKEADPRGFMDNFESRMSTHMMDIAQELGLHVEEKGDTFIFSDDMGRGAVNKAGASEEAACIWCGDIFSDEHALNSHKDKCSQHPGKTASVEIPTAKHFDLTNRISAAINGGYFERNDAHNAIKDFVKANKDFYGTKQKLAADKKADTADNPANEKDGEGAMLPKTDKEKAVTAEEKKFKVPVNGKYKYFADVEAAKDFCEAWFEKTGVVLTVLPAKGKSEVKPVTDGEQKCPHCKKPWKDGAFCEEHKTNVCAHCNKCKENSTPETQASFRRSQLVSAVTNAKETLADALDDTSALGPEDIRELRQYVIEAEKALAYFDANNTGRTASSSIDCEQCDGEGEVEGTKCPTCHGTGKVKGKSVAASLEPVRTASEYIADEIARPLVDTRVAMSAKAKAAKKKHDDEMEAKYGNRKKADVPMDVDDIFAELTEDFGPAPEVPLPGQQFEEGNEPWNQKSKPKEEEPEPDKKPPTAPAAPETKEKTPAADSAKEEKPEPKAPASSSDEKSDESFRDESKVEDKTAAGEIEDDGNYHPENKMTEQEVHDLGFEHGRNVASWVDVPEIGQQIPKHIDWVGYKEVTEENLADVMFMIATDKETESAFTSQELDNLAKVADFEVWEAFNSGVEEGMRAAINNTLGIKPAAKAASTPDYLGLYNTVRQLQSHGIYDSAKMMDRFKSLGFPATFYVEGSPSVDGHEIVESVAKDICHSTAYERYMGRGARFREALKALEDLVKDSAKMNDEELNLMNQKPITQKVMSLNDDKTGAGMQWKDIEPAKKKKMEFRDIEPPKKKMEFSKEIHWKKEQKNDKTGAAGDDMPEDAPLSLGMGDLANIVLEVKNPEEPIGSVEMLSNIVTSAKKASDLIHSDDQIGEKMETSQQPPVLGGNLQHTEPPNQNAMREALETQAETEVGKPIAQTETEVKADVTPQVVESGSGKQIIINIAADKSSAITSGMSSIDGEAPDLSKKAYEVEFEFRGKAKKASFSTPAARDEFIRLMKDKYGA
jgi:hypothetical protein